MNVYEEALLAHAKWKGKVETTLKSPITNKKELSIAYTPGVAQPCLEIAKDESLAYEYTWKGNTVAVVSDGSAVLGLGDIGPSAAMPVMEGKCALFKAFANVNAVPLCIDTKDPQEIINFCKQIAPTFGGINLEDISAPRCVEIERTLKKECSIPVFHDDQHGTAIVVSAGIMNALKVVGKRIEDICVVVSGTGAAGSSIIHMLHDLGVKEIYGFNINGIVRKSNADSYDFLTKELAEITNSMDKDISMAEALKEADVFVGVSAPRLLTKEMVASMKENPIVFAMANPEPEITYEDAIDAGAAVVGTGRSDFPNQINNVLAFPGLFRGALNARATKINEEMKLAAAKGIASLISDEELSPTYVIPSPFDPRVAEIVAKEVERVAQESGVAGK